MQNNGFKSNKKEGRDHPVVQEIHLGDLVELLVDGRFFQRTDDEYERYAGYVLKIGPQELGLSSTHHKNLWHGYTQGHVEENKRQKIVSIETRLIRHYRVLHATGVDDSHLPPQIDEEMNALR